MSQKTSVKRYLGLFLPSMLAYAVIFIAVAKLSRVYEFSPVIDMGLGLLAALPVFVAGYAFVRYLNEVDEFMRSELAKHLMIGFGLGTLLTFTWGLIEVVADLPKLGIYWVLPISMMIMGLSQLVSHLRHGTGAGCP